MRITTKIRRKAILTLVISGLSPALYAEIVAEPLAFAQLTAEHTESQDGLDFGGDRIRAGVQVRSDKLFGGLVLDFNVNDLGESPPGTLPNIIKDAYVGWHFDKTWSVKGGQFKSPVGMDFNTSGTKLDITKRGMEKGLVLERLPGVMLSAEGVFDSFGFDLGVFNPAGRSDATQYESVQEGEDNSAAARVRFEQKSLYAEMSYAVSEDAGGPATADYKVFDFGGRYTFDVLTLKAEIIAAEGLFGVEENEETVWYLHAGYRFSDRWETVLRHYEGESDRDSASSDLANTYVGVNFWPLNEEQWGVRLQLNYVVAGGDEALYTGTRGFRDDAVLFQLQFDLL